MEAKPLSIGDEITVSITVRGVGVTQESGIATAAPKLGEWQRAQAARLPDGARFESSDTFKDKPQGEHSVTRTLKVVADNGSTQGEPVLEGSQQPRTAPDVPDI